MKSKYKLRQQFNFENKGKWFKQRIMIITTDLLCPRVVNRKWYISGCSKLFTEVWNTSIHVEFKWLLKTDKSLTLVTNVPTIQLKFQYQIADWRGLLMITRRCKLHLPNKVMLYKTCMPQTATLRTTASLGQNMMTE